MTFPPFPYERLQEMASFDEEYTQELKKLYIKFFNEFPAHYHDCTIANPSKEKLAMLDHKHKPALAYLDLEILAKEIKQGRDLLENYPEKTKELTQINENIKNICHFYYKELNAS